MATTRSASLNNAIRDSAGDFVYNLFVRHDLLEDVRCWIVEENESVFKAVSIGMNDLLVRADLTLEEFRRVMKEGAERPG